MGTRSGGGAGKSREGEYVPESKRQEEKSKVRSITWLNEKGDVRRLEKRETSRVSFPEIQAKKKNIGEGKGRPKR